MNKKNMVVANGQIITESRFFYPAFYLSLSISSIVTVALFCFSLRPFKNQDKVVAGVNVM